MKMIKREHSVETILLAVTHLSLALQHVPESTPALKERAASLDTLANNLKSAQKAVDDAALLQSKPRFLVKLRNYQTDITIRSFSKHLDAAGFGRKSDVWQALFPDNLTAALRPSGESQLAVLAHLKTILQSRSSVWTESGTWLDKLTAEHTALATALKERSDAALQLKSLRDVRNQAKQTIIAEYIRLSGAIKEAFPTDKDLQEVFFDSLDSDYTANQEDHEDQENTTDIPV